MRFLRVFLLPLVFLGGLALFAYTVSGFFSSDTECAIGTCPETLYEGDSEKIFTYAKGAAFKVRLDERKNAYKDLHCSPAGVIEAVSLTPESPYYTGVFRSLDSGACLLESNTFSAMIVIQ